MKHLAQEKTGKNYKCETLDLSVKCCRMKVIVAKDDESVANNEEFTCSVWQQRRVMSNESISSQYVI